jgi:hypothetical protein
MVDLYQAQAVGCCQVERYDVVCQWHSTHSFLLYLVITFQELKFSARNLERHLNYLDWLAYINLLKLKFVDEAHCDGKGIPCLQ